MDPLTKKIVGTLVRSLLTLAAGYLIQHGLLPEGGSTEFVEAGVLLVLSVGWSIWQKYRGLLMIQAAKISPPSASMETVKAIALSGQVSTTGTIPTRPGTDRPNG